MVKSRIIVYTDRYKAEYGKCPRGYGHWFFYCKDRIGKRYECDFLGMYKEAKERAIEFACEHNSYVLHLMS